jgi:hypothetical protein
MTLRKQVATTQSSSNCCNEQQRSCLEQATLGWRNTTPTSSLMIDALHQTASIVGRQCCCKYYAACTVSVSNIHSVYPRITISRAVIRAPSWSLPQTSTNLRERRAEGDEVTSYLIFNSYVKMYQVGYVEVIATQPISSPTTTRLSTKKITSNHGTKRTCKGSEQRLRH